MIFYSLTVLTLIATVLGFFGQQHMYFDLLAHFRVHLLLISAVLFVISLFMQTNARVIVGVALIVNALFVLPLYVPYLTHARAAGEVSEIKLITANVKFNSENKDGFIEFIEKENPDIIFMQELNTSWTLKLKELNNMYPYKIVEDPGNEFGVGIYSKYRLKNSQVINIAEHETPTLKADVVIDGKELTLITVHPMPPISNSLFKSRNKMLQRISLEVRASKNPVIVGGDFNATMWAPNFAKLMNETGLKNAARGFGLKGTYPNGEANYKNFQNKESGKKTNLDLLPSWVVNDHPIKLPIDHVLVSKEIVVQNMTVPDIDYSDHLPIVTELSF